VRDRHALKYQVGLRGEQHAILEGARLTFVGIADDIMRAGRSDIRIRIWCAWCIPAGFPLQSGGEAGAAAAAQICALDFLQRCERAAREGRA